MSRAIAFLAVLVLLTLRFVDGAAHQHAHEQDPLSTMTVVVLDKDDDCGSDAFHAAAHCASHMADAMQRSFAAPLSDASRVSRLVPVTWSLLNDGRVLDPPVRPPLA